MTSEHSFNPGLACSGYFAVVWFAAEFTSTHVKFVSIMDRFCETLKTFKT